MLTRARPTRDRVQRVLAWSGLFLMIASVVWWQFLPGDSWPRRDSSAVLGGNVTRVVIDAGHGGNDSGAMRGGVQEKDLTLDVARRLDQLLRAQGLATTLTRAGDETVSLGSRAAAANQERDSVFVSIHFDEGEGAATTGVQTFYAVRQAGETSRVSSWLPFLQRASLAPNNLESQSLAGFVQGALVARTQAFDRGTRAQQFYVVANVRHPAVLVEGGFLSNNDDIAKLTSDDYRQQLAVAIGDGIMRYRAVARSPQSPLAAGGAGN
jgi:N-acetylmuramoyl-L-alanine amidase